MPSVSHLGYLGPQRTGAANRFRQDPDRDALLLSLCSRGDRLRSGHRHRCVKHQTGAPVAIRDIILSRGDHDTVIVTDAATGGEIATTKKTTADSCAARCARSNACAWSPRFPKPLPTG
jgi:hypothetical protein